MRYSCLQTDVFDRFYALIKSLTIERPDQTARVHCLRCCSHVKWILKTIRACTEAQYTPGKQFTECARMVTVKNPALSCPARVREQTLSHTIFVVDKFKDVLGNVAPLSVHAVAHLRSAWTDTSITC